MVGNRVLYISKACKASSVLLKLRVWKDDYHQKSPSNSKIHSRTDTRNTDTNPVACRYGGTTCQRNRESKHCRWPHSHLTSLVSISAAHPHHGPAGFQWTASQQPTHSQSSIAFTQQHRQAHSVPESTLQPWLPAHTCAFHARRRPQ